MLSPILALFLLAQPPAGIGLEWNVRARAARLVAELAQIKPALDKLRPAEWTGAPEGAYTRQHQRCLEEAGYAETAARHWVEQPERLTTALEVMLRLDSLSAQIQSLADGARRYQDAASGDSLMAALAGAAASRDQLRQHILELAAQREKEMEIMEKETQRCRTELARPAPPRRNP